MADKLYTIYDVSTEGVDKVLKDLDIIQKKFDDVGKAKNNAGKQTQQESDGLRKSREELEKLKVAEKERAVTLKQLQVEAKEAQILRQKELAEQRELRAGNKALEGSYNDIAKKYRELSQVVKNSVSLADPEATAKAQAELMKLKSVLDNFNRSLSRDGLLVGEYTSGIMQAFQQGGLGDLMKAQLDKAKQSADALDREFEELKNQLREMQNAGGGGLDRLESELIANRQEAERLRNQINGVETELQGMGRAGNGITTALKGEFSGLKNTILGSITAVIGLSAVFSRLQSEIGAGVESSKKMEGVEQAWNNAFGSDAEAKLQRLRVATNGLVTDLDLMKGGIKGANTNIAFEDLEKMFSFAQKRALQTGEDVNFLFNSVIEGVSKKSTQVLDNLQISASDIRATFGDANTAMMSSGEYASKVAGLLERESAKIGTIQGKNAEQIDRNKVSWENLRTELGAKLLPTLATLGSILLGIVSFLTSIPFGIVIAGVSLLTIALIANNRQWIIKKINLIKDTIETTRNYIATKILADANKGLSSALGLVTKGFKSLFSAIAKNPITALGYIILALVIWLGKLIVTSEKTKKGFDKVKESFVKIYTSLQPLIAKISEFIGLMGGKFSGTLNTVIDKILLPLANFILPHIANYFSMIAGGVNMFVGELLASVDTIKTWGSVFYDIIGGALTFDLDQMKKGFNTFFAWGAKRAKEMRKNWFAGVQGNGTQFSNVDLTNDDDNKPPAPPPAGTPKEQESAISKYKKSFEEAKKELENQRAKQLISEKEFDEKLLQLVNDYRGERLKAVKTANKEELSEKRDFETELLNTEKEITDKQFKANIDRLTQAKDLRQKELEQELEQIRSDKSLTETERLQKEIETQNKLIALKIDYNSKIATLAQINNQDLSDITQQANDAVLASQKELNQSLENLKTAQFEADKRFGEDEIEQERRMLLRRTNEILKNTKLTEKQRNELIEKEVKKSEDNIATIRLSQIERELVAYKQMLKDKLISQEDYNRNAGKLEDERLKIVEGIYKRANELWKKNRDENKKITDTWVQASTEMFQKMIETALEFQEREIESRYKNLAENENIEKQKRLDLATSEEEKEAIETEFENRAKERERQRNIERQEVARKQMALEFALASIKVFAGSGTFYEKLAQEAVLLTSYLASLALLNRQKFAKGGWLGDGGEVQGASHSGGGVPFNYEAEGGELAIINKRSASAKGNYSISGNPKQIASALNQIGGGVAFAGGASIRRFADGGYLGSSVRPPQFASNYLSSPSYQNGMIGNELNEMKAIVAGLSDVILSESYKPVILSTAETKRGLNAYNKQVEMVTL